MRIPVLMRQVSFALVALALCGDFTGAQRRPEVVPPSIVNRVRIDPTRPIDFHAATWPDTVYVGQQINYQVGVFLSEGARSRLRRNPEFLPPELRGLIAYELGTPRRAGSREAGGRQYDAHVFQRALFPVSAGEIVVPAPQLSYALPRSSSYFSREETFIVRAESSAVVVRDLPSVGRPADFNGAVGRFTTRARFDSDSPRVGDPVVMTLSVEGIGNVKLLPRPTLEVEWASVVVGSERLSIDSSGLLVRGRKEFDWILTPTREGGAELPPVRYVYFDPYRAEYDVALSTPVPVTVDAGTVVDATESESTTLLPLRSDPFGVGIAQRLVMIRQHIPYTVLVGLLVAVPLPALLLIAGSMRLPQRSKPVEPRPDLSQLAAQFRASRASGQVDSAQEARTVRRALHMALAQRLAVRVQQLTDRRLLAKLLRRRGATRETVASTLQLLDQLDQAGFASDRDDSEAEFAPRAAAVFEKVEAETLEPGRRHFGRISQLSAFALLTIQPTGNAAIPLPEQANAKVDSALVVDFATAVRTYEQRRFSEAASRFSSLAERAPDNVSVLANWGTAAWAQGDTVRAVIAWQRALRRDPLAPDLQERLQLLPPGAREGFADPGMMPADALVTVASAIWIAGWLFAFIHVVRKRRWNARNEYEDIRLSSTLLRGTAIVLICSGAVAGAYAFWDVREADADSLFVVARPETMRTGSGTDSDAAGGVTSGDIVRKVGTDGSWAEVEHADGRSGWLPTARLVPVEARTLPTP